MALYQRGRIWYADFYNGQKRVQVSTGTANKREAKKFLALRVSEVERSEYFKPSRITLAELGQQYMDYAKAHKRSWLRDEQILRHLPAAPGRNGPAQPKDLGHAIAAAVDCRSDYRCIGDRYMDGLLDERIFRATNADGSGNMDAIARLLAAEPDLAAKLEQLGRDATRAARRAAEAAVRGCLALDG